MIWIFHHVAVGYVADILEKLDYSVFKVRVGRCLVYVLRWFLGPSGEKNRLVFIPGQLVCKIWPFWGPE